jgi:DNA-binding NarL/FixJ family response regulator
MSSPPNAADARAAGVAGDVGARRSILVIDRDEISLWGFSFLFSRQSWVRRCLVSNHPVTALQKLRTESIDVVLIDDRFALPVIAQLLADIASVSPVARPMIVASRLPIDGPKGTAFVRRAWTAARIVAAVRDVADGALSTSFCPPRPVVRLTLREREVLDLIARGETNKEIALRLCLSPHTIKQHTCSAYRKLSARNRADAVTRARALGFVL